jgi:vancomycin resistance protein YoaR
MSRSVPAAKRISRKPPRTGLVVGLVALPLLVLAAVALFELANWDKITPGVTALGTTVGGLPRPEAVARLTPSVQQLLDRPLDIRGGDQTWHTTARELGLRLDPNELVGAAYQVGREGNPLSRLGEQLDTLTHGRVVSAASTTDRGALDGSISAMAQQVERPPTDARLTLASDGTIQSSGAADGVAVDIAASRDQITAALNGGGRSVELATSALPPAIPDQQLQNAHDELDRLLGPDAEPLTVTFGDSTWQLARTDVAKLVSLSGGTQPGQPAVVKLDDAPIKAWAARVAKDIDQPVQDARFAFNGGNLKVLRPSRQGRSLDQATMVQAVHQALLSDQRTLPLPVATVDPSVSSENPAALGITELIDRGSTSFAGSVPEKKHNIQLAAQRLNGVVVAPGATFSFNDSVGPTTIDAGFQWGFAIASGDDGPKTIPSVAGGICQVATTLFQPVFWSGYQLEERYWHLYWIPAYTSRGVVGLDVTVDSDAGLDFKWTNTTKDYVLIQSDTDNENIYFGLYGKKPNWKVQVDDAVITNRTPPDTKPLAQPEPTMPWGRTVLVETARDGFDAEVVRHVLPNDGGDPRKLDLKSTYQPARTVTLVGTAGKPATASVDDALQRVLDAQKPADPKPSPTPAAAGAPDAMNQPAPAPATTKPTPAPATNQAPQTNQPQTTNQAPQTNQPQATVVPAKANPTPAPRAPEPPAPTPKPTTKPSH